MEDEQETGEIGRLFGACLFNPAGDSMKKIQSSLDRKTKPVTE
jgi:hypothetical protein